jgi:hypothetical protein
VRALAALVLCLAVSSCSRLSMLHIINNSGGLIEIYSVIVTDDAGFEMDVRSWRRPYEVAHRTRTGPLVYVGEGPWRVRLMRGQCMLWYATPNVAASFGGDAYLQIEPDMRLFLAQQSLDRERYTLIEMEGFPVSPARHSCAPP